MAAEHAKNVPGIISCALSAKLYLVYFSARRERGDWLKDCARPSRLHTKVLSAVMEDCRRKCKTPRAVRTRRHDYIFSLWLAPNCVKRRAPPSPLHTLRSPCGVCVRRPLAVSRLHTVGIVLHAAFSPRSQIAQRAVVPERPPPLHNICAAEIYARPKQPWRYTRRPRYHASSAAAPTSKCRCPGSRLPRPANIQSGQRSCTTRFSSASNACRLCPRT